MKVDIENNLSFLDTLSCGLGGLMVLFFIFAALKDEGDVASKSIPAKINGILPMEISQVGLDKQIPPVHFELLLNGTKCTLENIQQMNLSIGRADRSSDKYYGTYWNVKNMPDMEINFSDCTSSSATVMIRLLNAESAACGLLIEKNNKFSITLSFSELEIIRVNKQQNRYQYGQQC